MNNEVDPQCSWVEVSLSNPTKDDMDSRSASVKRDDLAMMSSPLPESSPAAGRRLKAVRCLGSGLGKSGSAGTHSP